MGGSVSSIPVPECLRVTGDGQHLSKGVSLRLGLSSTYVLSKSRQATPCPLQSLQLKKTDDRDTGGVFSALWSVSLTP